MTVGPGVPPSGNPSHPPPPAGPAAIGRYVVRAELEPDLPMAEKPASGAGSSCHGVVTEKRREEE